MSSSTNSADLSGKVAVVTGAAAGLGRAEAIGLARAGATIVVNDIAAALDASDGYPFASLVVTRSSLRVQRPFFRSQPGRVVWWAYRIESHVLGGRRAGDSRPRPV